MKYIRTDYAYKDRHGHPIQLRHTIKISGDCNLAEISKWCNENGGNGYYNIDEWERKVMFEHNQDACFFLLRWGGQKV